MILYGCHKVEVNLSTEDFAIGVNDLMLFEEFIVFYRCIIYDYKCFLSLLV